jgi:carboxyl-terminal processing protease
VSLTIAREKSDPFDVKLIREVIKPKSATARLEGDYIVLRVASFNEKTTDEAEAAFAEMRAKNPKAKGLILDLRNNPGGLLDQAVGVSDLFLEGGEIVSQRGRDPRDVERYNARTGDMTNGMPMVVLINSGSASAAEIVIDGALKLTTARYYTPSGRSIQKTGIEPDLEVALTRDEAQTIANRAYQFSEASFRNALNADEGKVRKGAHEPAEAPPEGFDAKKDFQIARAEDVLRNGSVAATPKLPKPTARMAEIVNKAKVAEAKPATAPK